METNRGDFGLDPHQQMEADDADERVRLPVLPGASGVHRSFAQRAAIQGK